MEEFGCINPLDESQPTSTLYIYFVLLAVAIVSDDS